MALRPEEVSSIIKQEIAKYETKLELESVGTVLQVGDGIARVWGLEDAMMSELVQFPGDIMGMILNLEEDKSVSRFSVRIPGSRKVTQFGAQAGSLRYRLAMR